MNPIEFVVRLLWTAWPFVKEMVLEGRSLKHVFQVNRRRAIFSIVIMVSFLFNILNIGVETRMVGIMNKYVKLQKEDRILVAADKDLREQYTANNCPIPLVSTDMASSSVTTSSLQAGSADYQLLKNTFSGLNAKH